METLRAGLKSNSSDVDRMSNETSVYKRQYESLLQEYNQYLEDLESLQVIRFIYINNVEDYVNIKFGFRRRPTHWKS